MSIDGNISDWNQLEHLGFPVIPIGTFEPGTTDPVGDLSYVISSSCGGGTDFMSNIFVPGTGGYGGIYRSGFDLVRVNYTYDQANDTLLFLVQSSGAAGDRDGDGNDGGIGLEWPCVENSGRESPGVGSQESYAISFDFNKDGNVSANEPFIQIGENDIALEIKWRNLPANNSDLLAAYDSLHNGTALEIAVQNATGNLGPNPFRLNWTASAVANDPFSEETLVRQMRASEVNLTKKANLSLVHSGEFVKYFYEIGNNGSSTLFSGNLTDDRLGQIIPPPPFVINPGRILNVSTSISNNITYNITGVQIFNTICNTGTVNVIDVFGFPLSASNSTCVFVIRPNISITKLVAPTGNPTNLSHNTTIFNGSSVVYNISVKNTGDTTLFNVMIEDRTLGISPPVDIGTLLVNETKFLSPAPGRTFIGNGTFCNIANTTGHDIINNSGSFVRANDTACVVVREFPGNLSLNKTVNRTLVHSGDNVTYNYTIRNTNNTVLAGINLTDDKLGTILPPPGFNLSGGQSLTVSRENRIFTNNTCNNATVFMIDTSNGKVLNATDSECVFVIRPNISMTKLVAPANNLTNRSHNITIFNGSSVVYNISVTNTGDTTLFNVTIEDRILGISPPVDIGTLLVNHTKFLSPAPGRTFIGNGTFCNIANTTGHDIINNSGSLVRANDTACVVVREFPGNLSLNKTVNRTFVHTGDNVTYNYTIRNTNNTFLAGINLTDDKLGTILPPPGFNLSAGQSLTVSRENRIFTNNTCNNATVFMIDTSNGNVLNATDSECVFVIRPNISITKLVSSASPPKGPAHNIAVNNGTTVTYNITVTNTGDTALLNTVLEDATLGIAQNLGTLSPGQSIPLLPQPARTFNTAGTFCNIANTTGRDIINDSHSSVRASDTSCVVVTDVPKIEVNKSADKTCIPSGGTVVLYTFRVKNAGKVPLVNVWVNDTQILLNEHIVTPTDPPMLPDETRTITRSFSVTAPDITNTVEARGEDQFGNFSIATDTLFIPSCIVKTAPPSFPAFSTTGIAVLVGLINAVVFCRIKRRRSAD